MVSTNSVVPFHSAEATACRASMDSMLLTVHLVSMDMDFRINMHAELPDICFCTLLVRRYHAASRISTHCVCYMEPTQFLMLGQACSRFTLKRIF